jgi:hypothetical protein
MATPRTKSTRALRGTCVALATRVIDPRTCPSRREQWCQLALFVVACVVVALVYGFGAR